MSITRKHVYLCALGLFLGLALLEAIFQIRDSKFTQSVAIDVVQKAQAKTAKEKVVALRDYLRSHIRFQEAPTVNRPFFRDSASETLQKGIGYCGEVSRTFICMANAVGVEAQRINLFGKKIHVVAEADLGPEAGLVIVDCQYPPSIPDLETLDKVMQRPDYDDYSTLNLRRLGLNTMFSRVKLQFGGFITYLSERPHALKSALWLGLALGLLLLSGFRCLARRFLTWKGWIHSSDITRIQRISSSKEAST